MKIGVSHKLFLTILAAAGLAVISAALIMQWSFSRGFLKFVNTIEKSGLSNLATKLEQNYRTEQNWEFLRRNPEQWRILVASSMSKEVTPPGMRVPSGPPPEHFGGDKRGLSPPDGHLGEDMHGGPPPPARHFDERLFLLDANRKVLVSNVEVPIGSAATPLIYQGKVVGYLGLLPHTHISDLPHQRFLKEQKLASALVVGVVVILAALLSLMLARRIVRPLSEVALASQQLSSGIFSTRVSVTSNDELGQLAKAFNSLAFALENGELTRRQWVADISHELRTPLAVLRSETEALLDGIRQPTPDRISSLHSEVLRLGRLVDDLYQLSLSDVGALTYRKAELNLNEVLSESIAVYRTEFFFKEIELYLDISEKGVTSIFGDTERLCQLFSNLLENTLKYSDSGGRLEIILREHESNVVIDFKDSAPGVSPSELERLFDRLYRVDSSRNRSTGGAGLGLAICRNIVNAHGGTITALPSPHGGLWIRIELPKTGS